MNILEARRRTLGKGVYKKTVEGNPAIAQGSLARMYPGITMQGWTEQAQYEGKNLIDYKNAIARNDQQTVEIIDNGIKWSGDYYFKIPVSGVDPGETYTFSFTSEYCVNWAFRYSDGSISTQIYNGNPITTDPDKQVSEIFIYKSNPAIYENDMVTQNIMLNSGSTVLTYEPYTGGAPSPSPDYPQEIVSAGKYDEASRKYEYEVKLTGANLFDPDGEIVDGSPYDGIPLNNKGIVSMALYEKNPDVDVSNIYSGICSEELNSNNVIWALASGTIQSGGKIISLMNNRYVCWYPGNDATLQKLLSRYDVMVNYGGGVYLPYQPYKEQTVTLTADRPLTKWDKLEKRNGQWGWGYKSEEIESYTDESVPGEYFSTTGRLSTGAQVWYETTTETFVPLSESEQEQMNALHTFRRTTVLSNDCDCNMTLTYKTKKSLEVAT